MVFHQVFTRYIGTTPPGGKTMGSDVLPTGAPNQSVNDNCIYCAYKDLNGWPVHRVAVAYIGPVGATAVNGTMYFWENQLQAWIQIGAAQAITPGQVTFFDCVALLDTLQTNKGLDQGSPLRGSLAQLLIVPAGTGNGAHQFAIGADLSTAT